MAGWAVHVWMLDHGLLKAFLEVLMTVLMQLLRVEEERLEKLGSPDSSIAARLFHALIALS